ncbi:MAG TPA: hypothetical protein VKG82_04280 [Solirubrobacteraceae bacterium]|nr:hypothetical protein [Solirubrobacteraceae bacterium]
MTFIATTLLYPIALAALCVGAGLFVDRLSGGFLPASLLVTVGAAALIGLSQLTTYVSALAPATPYLFAALALAGLALARGRLSSLLAAMRARPLLACGPVLAYALALAPVLVAGRPSFSSFMALADSAVHMMGADYLVHHGQSYAHLDLRNSYGRFINAYYNTSYPSGADTLFGGSALLLRLPLIWAFQPFNAFMLASVFGPAWVLARRLAMAVPLAWLAALSAVLPALVYGYELLASVKEITALSMMMTAGALVVIHPRWLTGPARGGVPIALVLAAGTSALGPAFGVWGLAAVAVLAVTLVLARRSSRSSLSRAPGLIALAALVGCLAALPTLVDLRGSLQVASNIASTSNSGNLHTPLRTIQVFGIWLGGSYKLQPTGASLQVTHALIALAGIAAVIGAVYTVRIRAYALAGWIALTLLASLVVSETVTSWAEAKTLMITSPVVVLLSWAGVAAILALRPVAPARALGALLAAALLIGILVSDEMQYRSSNLAPTARYQELASVGSRFANQGPAVFTDFDEYALYELRKLDIGGPDFVYPPPALASAAGGYGDPVDVDRIEPAALQAYPLIITRRNSRQSRPPAAYDLAWRGDYYEVWRRRPDAPAALAHIGLSGGASEECRAIGALARGPGAHARAGSTLVAAEAPELVEVSLASAARPARWGHARSGLVMTVPGKLVASFHVPATGVWEVWVQGQIMPTVALAVDGRTLEQIGGQLSGNSLVPDTVPPRRLTLAAGSHTIVVDRGAVSFAPGARGSAMLDAIFLTPAAAPAAGALARAPLASWRSLCGRRYEWVELLTPAG